MHRRRTSLQFGMAFVALCLVVSLAGCSQKGEDTASPGQVLSGALLYSGICTVS